MPAADCRTPGSAQAAFRQFRAEPNALRPTSYAHSDTHTNRGTAEPWHRTRTRTHRGEQAEAGSPLGRDVGPECQGQEPGPEPAGVGQGADRQVGPGHRGQQDGGGRAAAATSPSREAGRPPRPSPRRFSGAMMAWGAVGLVIVVVAVLVIVKVATGGSCQRHLPTRRSPRPRPRWSTTSPTSPNRSTTQVGVNFPSAAAGVAPINAQGQPPLTLDGKSPAMLYYGAEYCPYCAAERWAHHRRAVPVRDLVRTSRSPPRPTPTSTPRPTPSATTGPPSPART